MTKAEAPSGRAVKIPFDLPGGSPSLFSPRGRARRFGVALVFAGSAALLSGCASAPVPSEQLAVARSSVSSAVAAGGTEHAPVEMRAAQRKLTNAEAALGSEDYVEARRLAEAAEVDARLAERKALAAKARMYVDESQKTIRVLREEMQQQPVGTGIR